METITNNWCELPQMSMYPFQIKEPTSIKI